MKNELPQTDRPRITVRRQNNGLWEVLVQVFKDSYWNTLAYRTYQKKVDAERYAARFN